MAKSLQDLIRQHRESLSRQAQTIKPANGKTVWRILPSIDPTDPMKFYRQFGQHWIKNRAGELQAVVVCDDKTFDKPCEVCTALAQAKLGADEETKKVLDEAYAKTVYLFNAVCVEGPKGVGELHILELGKKAVESLFTQMEENPEILDPGVDGCDIVINRSGTGLTTTYTVSTRPASKSKPVPESLLMQRKDLDAFVQSQVSNAKKEKGIATFAAVLAEAGALAKPVNTAASARLTAAPAASAAIASRPAMTVATEVEDAEVVPATRSKPAAVTSPQFDGELSNEDIESLLAQIGS